MAKNKDKWQKVTAFLRFSPILKNRPNPRQITNGTTRLSLMFLYSIYSI